MRPHQGLYFLLRSWPVLIWAINNNLATNGVVFK
jgi:hypothetical protein